MASGRLLTIVPTRGRPQNITKVIEAWVSTDAFDHADLLFVIDRDSPSFTQEADAVLSPGPGGCVMVAIEDRWVPMVNKLDRAAYRVAMDSAPGLYAGIGFAGDDHLPRTNGWAKQYLDRLHALRKGCGHGIVYGNDGYQGEKLATEWAMTPNIIKALGRMVPAPVQHLYCDNSVMDLGRSLGCLEYLPDVEIEHMHPWAHNKGAFDAQYRRVNSRAQYDQDGTAYRNWLKYDGPKRAALAVEAFNGGR